MGLITKVPFDVELTKATQVEALPNILVSGDMNSYEIEVSLYRNGLPVDVTGAAVVGTGMLPGNISVFAEGAAEGNKASFIMGSDFFSKKGKLTVLLTVTIGGVQTTVFSGVTNVLKSAMDTSIADGASFPASALIEAAKNEDERIANELARQHGYEAMQETCRVAEQALDAGLIRMEEDEEHEGYFILHGGLEYDARAEDDKLRQEHARLEGLISGNTAAIAGLTGKTGQLESKVSAAEGEIRQATANAEAALQSVNTKLDATVDPMYAGKVLVINQSGEIKPGDATFLDQLVAATKLACYPVGSVFTSFSNTADPHELFGGTWIRVKDVFLWAANEDDDVDGETVLGTATHTHTAEGKMLVVSDLPAHTHPIVYNNGSIYGGGSQYGGNPVSSIGTGTQNANTGENAVTEQTAHTHTIAEANHMPPHIKVYVWQRTA